MPAAKPMAGMEIRALTGLRGIAAVLVVIYHFAPWHSLSIRPVANVIGKGYLCVDLFFILSGFLLSLNYAHHFADGWSLRRWGDFLLRRLARIYPLYFVLSATALLTSLALYYHGHGGSLPGGALLPATLGLAHPAGEIVANGLLIQSWGITHSIDGPAWSISTEWAAYLLFPLMAAAALFSSRGSALAVAAGAALLVGGTVFLTMTDGAYHSGPLDAYDGGSFEPILRCLGGFTLGMVTYRVAQSRRILALASADGTLFSVLALLLLAAAAGLHDLVLYPLFALLVLGLYGNCGRVGRGFGIAPIYWLGLTSYAIYLLHLDLLAPRTALIDWLQAAWPAPWPRIAADAICYIVLLIGADLAYRWIEVPGRRWLRRLGRPADRGRQCATEELRRIDSRAAGTRTKSPPSWPADRMSA